MILKLNHDQQYEWTGTFWFPEAMDVEFAGKVLYTPEKGVRISLFNTTGNGFHRKSKYIMHGIVRHDEKTISITLFEVFLQATDTTLGGVWSENIEGWARALVAGRLLDNLNISGLCLDYDDSFYNFLMYDKEISVAAMFSDNPATVDKVKFCLTTVRALGRNMVTPDDFDNIICSFTPKSKKVIYKFKQLVKPFLNQHKYELLWRTDANIGVHINAGRKKLPDYRKIERIWRWFWNVLLGFPVATPRCWVHITEKINNTNICNTLPMLSSDYRPPKRQRKQCPHHMSLPINIRTFSQNADLGVFNKPLERWFAIHRDKNWQTLIFGVMEIIERDSGIIQQKEYVILVSYIETLQNLQGKAKSSDLNGFISAYASKEWISNIEKLTKFKPAEDGNIGKCLCEIRNAIVHPKAHLKKNGKYYDIANEEFLLQNIYGNLVGLFMKAFMLEIFEIPDKAMERYLNVFIGPRASFQLMKYE
jgi:hypothetical protein